MTEERQAWGPAGSARQHQEVLATGGPPAVPATPPAPAGWYPDPWSRGQHRFWDGSVWTGGSFPHGATDPGAGEGRDTVELPLPPPTALGSTATLPPPHWSPPAPPPGPRTDRWQAVPRLDDPPSSPSQALSRVGFVALVVAVMLVVGSLGTLGGYLIFRHRSPSASGLPPNLAPGGSSPATTVPADPSASVLQTLGLTQADVDSTIVVQPTLGGDGLSVGTLDLCNGTFPSESLRTARLQVGAFDTEGNEVLSTESVLYQNPAATEQAFAELKSVAANCPSTPVVSPIGEPTVITQFNAAPDGAWPQTAGVTRQAYDFTSTDELGTMQRSVAVYLRRGRVLMGVYFPLPDPQVSVAGQTTIESIVGVFAGRIANLPASVVGG